MPRSSGSRSSSSRSSYSRPTASQTRPTASQTSPTKPVETKPSETKPTEKNPSIQQVQSSGFLNTVAHGISSGASAALGYAAIGALFSRNKNNEENNLHINDSNDSIDIKCKDKFLEFEKCMNDGTNDCKILFDEYNLCKSNNN